MTGLGLTLASGAARSTMHRPANLWACSHTGPEHYWAPMLMQSSSAAEIYLHACTCSLCRLGRQRLFGSLLGLQPVSLAMPVHWLKAMT